jgi:hypothetical protein
MGAIPPPQLSEMETDEEWCIAGEELDSIVWRRVHKLFTSDCILVYTTYSMSHEKFLSIK